MLTSVDGKISTGATDSLIWLGCLLKVWRNIQGGYVIWFTQ